MKSLQKIADELEKKFTSEICIIVDKGSVTIDVYKPNYNLWCQVDFDILNEVMTENGLIMWMRMENVSTKAFDVKMAPVFHLHKK